MFAQDEATCTVWGMPRAVIEAGLAEKILPLKHVASEIVVATNRPRLPQPVVS
ncbi:MAG: chemotaxis protein CheB [Planctomycetaceae bacterium]